MSSFHITGPGLYRNRRGDRVEIVSYDDAVGFWFDSNSFRYLPNGMCRRIDSYDLVGVWEERRELAWEKIEEALKKYTSISILGRKMIKAHLGFGEVEV